MVKEINLYFNFGKYNDGNVYELIDEDLTIKINHKEIIGGQLFFIISNGKESKKGIINNNLFVIEKEFLKIGKLSIKINLTINGNIIRKYNCEDLIIKEIDGKIKCIPEIENMRIEIKDMKKRIIETNKNVETLTKLVSALYNKDII